jgi:AraC family transcriptional regulator
MERQESSNQIEARMATGMGEVTLRRERWTGPIDVTGRGASHHLQLSLLPSSANARGCFVDDWGPHRFEPMGEMFLLPAEHALRARSDCLQQQSIVCSYDPEALNGWFDGEMEWTDRRLAGSLDISSIDVRRLLFRMGEELRSPGFAAEQMVELLAAQVSIELSRYLLGIEEPKMTGGLAPWRLRLIDDALAHDCANASLGELARLCNLSVRHLTRAFRISRGRSIGSYIADQRVYQARRLLAAGMPVKAVAHATGFTAPSNFTAAFRRVTGESPRAYRQRAMRGQACGGELVKVH